MQFHNTHNIAPYEQFGALTQSDYAAFKPCRSALSREATDCTPVPEHKISRIARTPTGTGQNRFAGSASVRTREQPHLQPDVPVAPGKARFENGHRSHDRYTIMAEFLIVRLLSRWRRHTGLVRFRTRLWALPGAF
jgi:hypothetical protein